MKILNPYIDGINEIIKSKTNIKEIERPKALTGKKQFYFERLEYIRQFNPKWYKFLLQKYLKRLTNVQP